MGGHRTNNYGAYNQRNKGYKYQQKRNQYEQRQRYQAKNNTNKYQQHQSHQNAEDHWSRTSRPNNHRFGRNTKKFTKRQIEDNLDFEEKQNEQKINDNKYTQSSPRNKTQYIDESEAQIMRETNVSYSA